MPLRFSISAAMLKWMCPSARLRAHERHLVRDLVRRSTTSRVASMRLVKNPGQTWRPAVFARGPVVEQHAEGLRRANRSAQ